MNDGSDGKRLGVWLSYCCDFVVDGSGLSGECSFDI